MISKKGIDYSIDRLLILLGEQQQDNGSFSTKFYQPIYNPTYGWMTLGDSCFDSASIIIPLLHIESSRSRSIIEKTISYVQGQGFEGKLWSYPTLNEWYLHFHDTDSTALCSFVLEQNGVKCDNKKLLNQLSTNGHYLVFVDSFLHMKNLSLSAQFNLWRYNRKVKKSLAYANNLLRETDLDFVVSCNNLLYLGGKFWDSAVWMNAVRSFENKSFQQTYYPSIMNSVHAFARLVYLRKDDHNLELSGVTEYMEKMYSELNPSDFFLDKILFASSVLYLGLEVEKFQSVFQECFAEIDSERFMRNAALYSCNLKTDLQPDGKSPNTYFGSPAITCSLYLEFLNLYRKRVYYSYYGEC